MHKKRPKICTHYEVSTAKIYLYHSSKNTSSRPPSGLSSEYNSVQGILVVLDLLHWDSKRPKKYQITTGSMPQVRFYSHCRRNGVRKRSIKTPSHTPLRQWGLKITWGNILIWKIKISVSFFLYWKILLEKIKRYLFFSSLIFFGWRQFCSINLEKNGCLCWNQQKKKKMYPYMHRTGINLENVYV